MARSTCAYLLPPRTSPGSIAGPARGCTPHLTPFYAGGTRPRITSRWFGRASATSLSPHGGPIQDTEIPGGATLASPERMLISEPLPWSARIRAFRIYEEGQFFDREPWALRAKADGVTLRKLR